MAPRLIASIVHIPRQVGYAVTARWRRSIGDLARTPLKCHSRIQDFLSLFKGQGAAAGGRPVVDPGRSPRAPAGV
jgi:hypothetical protein